MMKKGTHKTITVTKKLYDELIRIKYSREFKNLNDVIIDLLDLEAEELKEMLNND